MKAHRSNQAAEIAIGEAGQRAAALTHPIEFQCACWTAIGVMFHQFILPASARDTPINDGVVALS